MYELHEALNAGDHGINLKHVAVTRMFWWPNMKRTVQHCVRCYVTCQRYKEARHKPYGLLQSHKAPIRPIEHV
jgi:hypothetical protein